MKQIVGHLPRSFQLLLLLGIVELVATIVIAFGSAFWLIPAIADEQYAYAAIAAFLLVFPVGQIWLLSRAADLARSGDRSGANIFLSTQIAAATLLFVLAYFA